MTVSNDKVEKLAIFLRCTVFSSASLNYELAYCQSSVCNKNAMISISALHVTNSNILFNLILLEVKNRCILRRTIWI